MTTDWVWRPKLWHSTLANPALSGLSSDTALSNEVKLFHDAQYTQSHHVKSNRPLIGMLRPLGQVLMFMNLMVDIFLSQFGYHTV